MPNWLWQVVCVALVVASACDGGEEPTPKTRVVEPIGPEGAVQAAKLKYEAFVAYRYCDRAYPATCADGVGQAYVLPRTGGEDYRVVFWNNQDPRSTLSIFDYVTVSYDGKTVVQVGHFEVQEAVGQNYRNGAPLWGIPE